MDLSVLPILACLQYLQPGNRFTISLFTASAYGKQSVASWENNFASFAMVVVDSALLIVGPI